MEDEELEIKPTDGEAKHDNPLENFIKKNTSVKNSKNDDDLIDLHIGNPLRKITKLLEDIKSQKAFSFTLKGSLGIMGVALVIGSFGIFGGTKAFCDKGIQTKVGIIKTLTYQEIQKDSWVDFVPILNSFFPKKLINRVILETPENDVYNLIFANLTSLIPDSLYSDATFYVTGSLDSCSNTLRIENQNGIERN